MGMDVHGTHPTAPVGEHLWRNVWSWRPLARYACLVAPSITEHCQHWQTNDGDGLDADQSRRLADHLDFVIANGATAAYVADRDARLAAMPDEPCPICTGTGRRLPPPKIGAGLEPCNGCAGVGARRPYDTYYPLDVDSVREFSAFLRTCGGFEID